MSAFNIEAYLNSLPDYVEEIDVSYKGLTYLPDLSRFKKLKKLYCHNNFLVSLPSLPKSLMLLSCWGNKLISLPPLPDSLEELWSGYNRLSSLPLLPNSLQQLNCRFNQLVSLPSLPNSLYYLSCDNNQLVTLPLLSNSIEILYCHDNPLEEFVDVYDLVDNVKEYIVTLNKFRSLYYCIKYKNKFRKWLWDVRENKAKEEYHPDRLKEMLEGKDINDIDF